MIYFFHVLQKRQNLIQIIKKIKSKKEEEIIAVTTRELCDYFKEINKKPIPQTI